MPSGWSAEQHVWTDQRGGTSDWRGRGEEPSNGDNCGEERAGEPMHGAMLAQQRAVGKAGADGED